MKRSAPPRRKKHLASSRKPVAQMNPARKARRARGYRARLARADWTPLRLACFERDDFRCTGRLAFEQTTIRCTWRDITRTGKGLIADHKTYARFGRENLDDLRTLCSSCNSIETTSKRANWAEPRRRSA